MTKSTKDDNTEFIVHVKSEYDYHFECDNRQDIFNAVKYVYFMENKSNLPVYGVPDKLKHYATSKKDISAGYEVDPKEQFRMRKEDLYPENSTAGGSSSSIQNSGSTLDSSGSFDEINQYNTENAKIRSNTLYTRNAADKSAELKDFIIKSVIGRGSFGKVFLVQKASDGKVFAMKSLRKDVILDYDQIESTLLEKEILKKADHPFLVGMEYVF